MPNWVTNNIVVIGNEDCMKKFLSSITEEKESLQEMVDDLSKKELKLSSFKPIPEDFHIEIDTTNHPDKYPEIATYQKEHYGVVGWYEFNLMWFGCKWDVGVKVEMLVKCDNKDLYELHISTETPWSPPTNWLLTLRMENPKLTFIELAIDECFNFVSIIDYTNDESIDCLEDKDPFEDEEIFDEIYERFNKYTKDAEL